jgi:hypothetical protein
MNTRYAMIRRLKDGSHEAIVPAAAVQQFLEAEPGLAPQVYAHQMRQLGWAKSRPVYWRGARGHEVVRAYRKVFAPGEEVKL